MIDRPTITGDKAVYAFLRGKELIFNGQPEDMEIPVRCRYNKKIKFIEFWDWHDWFTLKMDLSEAHQTIWTLP